MPLFSDASDYGMPLVALLLALTGAGHLVKHYRRRLQPPSPATASPERPAHRGVVVTMPPLGEDVTEVTVIRWLKQVGEQVRVGEPLLEVSMDKVDAEIPAEAAGVLHEIRVVAGGTARVGATIAVIEP